jgi:hypothetical protein
VDRERGAAADHEGHSDVVIGEAEC